MTVNTSVTSGTIAIEDGTKAKEEFAPARKVKVELTFSVPEGQDGVAYMHGVARIADAKVASMLGRTAPAETAAPATPAVPPVEGAKAPAKPETAAAKKKREAAEAAAAAAAAGTGKTKDDLAREAGLPTGDIVTKTAANDGELEDEPEITAAGKVVAAEEPDELNDLLGDAAPVPVTDAELGKAAQEKNAKAKAEYGEKWAPAKIRDLIAEFAGAGKRINEIPAAKRHEFLTKLEALK